MTKEEYCKKLAHKIQDDLSEIGTFPHVCDEIEFFKNYPLDSYNRSFIYGPKCTRPFPNDLHDESELNRASEEIVKDLFTFMMKRNDNDFILTLTHPSNFLNWTNFIFIIMPFEIGQDEDEMCVLLFYFEEGPDKLIEYLKSHQKRIEESASVQTN